MQLGPNVFRCDFGIAFKKDTCDGDASVPRWNDELVGFELARLRNNCFVFTGTMSGGGKSVSKGRMGGKIVQDVGTKDVEKMEKDVDAVVVQLQVC